MLYGNSMSRFQNFLLTFRNPFTKCCSAHFLICFSKLFVGLQLKSSLFHCLINLSKITGFSYVVTDTGVQYSLCELSSCVFTQLLHGMIERQRWNSWLLTPNVGTISISQHFVTLCIFDNLILLCLQWVVESCGKDELVS